MQSKKSHLFIKNVSNKINEITWYTFCIWGPLFFWFWLNLLRLNLLWISSFTNCFFLLTFRLTFTLRLLFSIFSLSSIFFFQKGAFFGCSSIFSLPIISVFWTFLHTLLIFNLTFILFFIITSKPTLHIIKNSTRFIFCGISSIFGSFLSRIASIFCSFANFFNHSSHSFSNWIVSNWIRFLFFFWLWRICFFFWSWFFSFILFSWLFFIFSSLRFFWSTSSSFSFSLFLSFFIIVIITATK